MSRFTTWLKIALAFQTLTPMAIADVISEVSIYEDWVRGRDLVVGEQNAAWFKLGDTVTNSGNYGGSLTSDFTASSSTGYTFSTTVKPIDDNDLFGLVFGWQDADNAYMLSWGGGDRGLNLGPGQDWNGIRLAKQVGSETTFLATYDALWTAGTVYDFSITHIADTILVSILQGEQSVFSTDVVDGTFSSGKVGFDTWSQFTQFGFGSTEISDPPLVRTQLFTPAQVPEPSSLAGLTGIGLLLLVWHGWRRRHVLSSGTV